jgi:hypothetical protein
MIKSSSNTSDRFNIYEAITNQIIAAIESGTGDVQMPWHQSGASICQPDTKSIKGIAFGSTKSYVPRLFCCPFQCLPSSAWRRRARLRGSVIRKLKPKQGIVLKNGRSSHYQEAQP